MMKQFIRYYRQNKRKIWETISIISFTLVIMYMFFKEESKKGEPNHPIKTELNQNTSKLTSNKSDVTGEIIPVENQKDKVETIDQFLTYCNEGKIEEAYQLLTDECKEQMYKTIDIFQKEYCEVNFESGKKSCSIGNWVGNTYKIRIVDDILSQGKSNEGYVKQDYITVIWKQDKYQLNINQYIAKNLIQKTTENDNLKVEIIENNQYMDYETYTMKVTNKSESEIILDTMSNTKTLYLIDENGKKYSACMNELAESILQIEEGHSKTINIKFYSKYIATKKIEAMVFSDLIIKKEGKEIKEEFIADR